MPTQENNSLSIFVCPFCFQFKMLYQKPMTKEAEASIETHINNCRKKKINE
jgi:hypothetical protein